MFTWPSLSQRWLYSILICILLITHPFISLPLLRAHQQNSLIPLQPESSPPDQRTHTIAASPHAIPPPPSQTPVPTPPLLSSALTLPPSLPPSPHLVPSDQSWIGPAGGIFHAASLSLTVAFPPDAVSVPVLVQLTPLSTTATLSPTLITSFALTATTALDAPITSFARPVTLTLALAPTEGEVFDVSQGSPTLLQYHPISDTWSPLPSQVAWSQWVVRAPTTHFSTFGLGPQEDLSYGAQHLPTLRVASADEWGGNGTVDYPLTLPPGPGGLDLALSLSYTSETVNSTRQGPTERPSALDRQASLIGWGWSLNGLGSITYDRENNRYFLVTPHHSTELKQTASGWQSEPQHFLRVERQPSGNAQYLDRWYVWTPDGMLYVYGGAQNAGFTWNNTRILETEGVRCLHEMREAYLTEIHDAKGNKIEITYRNDERDEVPDWYCDRDEFDPFNVYVRAIRPDQIKFFPAAPALAGLETAQVEFRYTDDRKDTQVTNWDKDSVQTLWTDYRLTQIVTKIRTSPTTMTPARTYDLGQRYWRNQEATLEAHLLLMSITETISISGTLPPWTFTYDEARPLNHALLLTANNGQGGTISFGYDTIDNIPMQGCGASTRRFHTTYLELDDGLGLSPTTHTDYTHSSPIAWTDSSCLNFQFGGYGHVTRLLQEKANGQTTAVQQGQTWYHQGAGNNADPRKGRAYQRELLTPTGQVLQREETKWSHTTERGTDWIYREAITTTLDGATQSTTFSYVTDHQGGAQYGNVTHVRDYLDQGVTLLRTREIWYYPRSQNSTPRQAEDYIVDRPAREVLWDAGNTCQGETRWWYDTNTDYTQPPVQGFLTRTQVAQHICGGSWSEIEYEYDLWGNRTAVADPRNNTTSTNYDTDVNALWPKLYRLPISTTPPLIGTTTYTWDKVIGQVVTVVDPHGLASEYRYDNRGRLQLMWQPENGDSQSSPTHEISYQDYTGPTAPARMRVSQKRGPSLLPHDLYTFYDGLGREVQTRTAIIDATDATQTAVSLQVYGAFDLPTKVYVPVQEGASGAYSGHAWPSSRPHTATSYDGLGRELVVIQPDGTRLSHHYGMEVADGQVQRWHDIVDGNRHRRQYRTDTLGRLVRVDEIAGNCGNYWAGYECAGDHTTEWYPATTTRYGYDMLDRLIAVTGPVVYSDTIMPTPTQIEYDLAGRKTRLIDPDLGTWNYPTYDAAGNLLTQIDARGCTTTFTYDALNRITHKSYTGPLAECDLTPDVTYTYDDITDGNRGLGRRTGMQAGSTETTWHYDGRGRPITETVKVDNQPFITHWAYDSSNQVSALTYPDGEQVNFSYHRDQRLNQVSSSEATYVARSDYDVWGRLTARQFGTAPVDLQTAWGYYDWADTQGQGGRLHTLTVGSAADPDRWQALAYQYDRGGNLHTITDTAIALAPVLLPQVQQFRYDHLDRLISASADGTHDEGGYGESYSYDVRGNLQRKGNATYTYASPRPHAVTGVSDATCSLPWDVAPNGVVDVADLVAIGGAWQQGAPLGYDVAGQDGRVTIQDIQTIAGHWGQRCVDASLVYDANGNLTKRTLNGIILDFTYDAENRLINVRQGPFSLATFGYDGDGHRIQSTFTALPTGPSTTTTYIGTLYEQSDTLTRKYYYAGAHRVAMRVNGVLSWLLTDHLGSTNITLNAEATIKTSELRYTAFGELRYSAGPPPTRRRYTGQLADVELGLLFYGSRSYDPALARFVQPDSQVPIPRNPQALNRYSYVLNNPVRYHDPSGHQGEDWAQRTWEAVGEFATGLILQWGHNNSWIAPEGQAALAAQPNESGWMTAGRLAGDVTSLATGALEITAGTGSHEGKVL